MDTTANIILVIVIAYLFITSLVMKTQNFLSSLIFKVLPFFAGFGLLYVLALNMGWIK